LKLAPLVTAATVGAAVTPDPDATLTATDALLAPLYVAVIVPLPGGNAEPFNVNVAVAVAADPVNTADPNEAPAIENETDPAGVVPSVEDTVAIKYITSFAATVLKLLSSVTFAPEAGGGGAVVPAPFHPVTSLYISTDPIPVH
jgi:hypothetical protein